MGAQGLGFGAYGVLGFGLRAWGWGLGFLIWGLGLWVGSLDSLQNIKSFGSNQDFFQKARCFLVTIFSGKLRYFLAKKLFVNKSHTFTKPNRKFFCKTSKNFAEKHIFFLQNSRIVLQKLMVCVEKQNNFTTNSTFRAQNLGFVAGFWIQGFVFFGFVLRVFGFGLRFFGVFVMAVICDCCCFGRNNIKMREICSHSHICNSENHFFSNILCVFVQMALGNTWIHKQNGIVCQ